MARGRYKRRGPPYQADIYEKYFYRVHNIYYKAELNKIHLTIADPLDYICTTPDSEVRWKVL